MGIIYFSNKSLQKSRKLVLNYIKDHKLKNPNFRVIDVGGRHNPWADDIVDAYVDLLDFNTNKKKYVGDINKEHVWTNIKKDGQYDFSICTQTLEDIRNPIFVIEKLKETSKAGYISTPNKHCELSHPTSTYWLGYAHHRWIFSIKLKKDNEPYLFIMPKWPCVEYFNRNKVTIKGIIGSLLENLRPYRYISYPYILFIKLMAKMGLRHNKQMIGFLDTSKKRFGSNKLDWLDEKLTSIDYELGFIWEHDFIYEFIDYSTSTDWQIQCYRELLKESF